MYKLKLRNFANCPAITITDENNSWDFFAPQILRTKNEADKQIDKIQKEVQNREETLKDLKMLREELKE